LGVIVTVTVGHVRGLHRGVLPSFKRRGGLQPAPSPGGMARGLRLLPSQPHHDWRMIDLLGHDNSFIAGARTTAEHRAPPRAVAHFSGEATSVSPHSASQRRVRGSATVKQSRWQASNHCGPAARAAIPPVGEDLRHRHGAAGGVCPLAPGKLDL
jgi:hypothetical protein